MELVVVFLAYILSTTKFSSTFHRHEDENIMPEDSYLGELFLLIK